jgi:hypothetical protein
MEAVLRGFLATRLVFLSVLRERARFGFLEDLLTCLIFLERVRLTFVLRRPGLLLPLTSWRPFLGLIIRGFIVWGWTWTGVDAGGGLTSREGRGVVVFSARGVAAGGGISRWARLSADSKLKIIPANTKESNFFIFSGPYLKPESPPCQDRQKRLRGNCWWRCRDSNPGHCGYEPHALTS